MLALARRHSTLFCFIYHPIEMEGNIERCTAAAAYSCMLNTELRMLDSVSLGIFSHEIHADQLRFRYMMTNSRRCVCDVHSGCIRHSDAQTIINMNSTKCMLMAKTHKRKRMCGWAKPWDAIDRAHVVTMPTIQSSSEYFIFSTYRM